MSADLTRLVGARDPAKERIFIRADEKTRYGAFMEVMNTLQDNGFYSVALVGEDNAPN
jgi:biopolymer transport protein ExbD